MEYPEGEYTLRVKELSHRLAASGEFYYLTVVAARCAEILEA
jgi:hypothetical protein